MVFGEDKDTGEAREVEERGEQELEAREGPGRGGLEEVVRQGVEGVDDGAGRQVDERQVRFLQQQPVAVVNELDILQDSKAFKKFHWV